MDDDEPKDLGDADFSVDSNCSAVNKLVLDYYKKFGRKRNIEQFFSLSTAQDLSEPSCSFWKTMKEQNDSSDSGDKKTATSMEVCRISIKCSMNEPNTSKVYNKNTDSDTESPPIISDDVPDKCLESGDESNKSDGENSHKSIDVTLDTSLNRPHSPTSSVTSQRKLEWDSLADVGYGNESDRKNSASSLSTLERLALHQQYSNNDTKPNSELGIPTAHSTPLDQTESKSKVKKDGNKRTSKFCKKDVDVMEVNIPNTSDNNQPINVNLTKHISFNVEKDGVVKMDNMTNNISVSRDKLTPDALKDNIDKEIQTTLPYSKDNVALSADHSSRPRFPILVNFNTLRNRKKKRRRKLSRPRKKETVDKENIPQEKSINQESDAESFEYMPGHMYNQNNIENKGSILNVADNKSSLESSAGHTTESSKDLKCTFTKELEKSIDLLKLALQHRYKDTSLKNKLIREVVQSLVQTNYKNDDSKFKFEANQNIQSASSTSESNNLDDNKRSKNSMLRAEKFDFGEIASTSQSAPNLPVMSCSKNPENLLKPVNLSSTDSDLSYKSKYLSEVFLANSSSEEIYKKYLIALKKENLYKKKLKEQELLLRQRITQPSEQVCVADAKVKGNLDHLIKDLSKNNFADGSGDASNACHSSSNVENGSGQRSKSHTVFTLSGENNDLKKNKKLRNRLESEINCSVGAGSCTQCQSCAYRREKVVVTDSSVQVNFDNQATIKTDNIILEQSTTLNKEKYCYEKSQENIKYVCLCTENPNNIPDNFLIYKCSRLPSKCIMVGSKTDISPDQRCEHFDLVHTTYARESKDLLTKKSSATSTQSSQTHFSIPKLTKTSCNIGASSSKYTNLNRYNREGDTASSIKRSCNTCTCQILTQTEISIDPKISDPSISDIKIIESDVYDFKENEGENNVSGSSNNDKKEKNKICQDGKHSHTKNNTVEDSMSKPIKQDVIFKSHKHKKLEENNLKLTSSQNLQPQSNFTIPIHGTNMTLKVCLDSRDSQEEKTKDIKPSILQDFGELNVNEVSKPAEHNYVTLQSKTAMQKQTECISVQTSNMEQKDMHDEFKTCYTEAKDSQKPTTSAYRYESVDMRHTNTVPKKNTRKVPLLRSNTDTGKIESFDSLLPTDKKNTDVKEKSINEHSSQASFSKFPKKSLVAADYDKKEYIDRYTSMDTKHKKLEEETSTNILLRSKTVSNKKELSGHHKSIVIEQEEQQSTENKDDNSKYRSLEKSSVKSNFDSEKMAKDNINLKDRILNNPLENADSDSSTSKKEFPDSRKSKGKENENVKEPVTKSSSDEMKFKAPINVTNKKDVDTQYDSHLTHSQSKDVATEIADSSKSSSNTRGSSRQKCSGNSESTDLSSSNTNDSRSSTQDPLLDIIRDITKRYSKKDVDKTKRKKCYAEIITVLNYLLDTSGTSENESSKARSSSEHAIRVNKSPRKSKNIDKPKKTVQNDVKDYNECIKDYKTTTHDFKIHNDKAKKTFIDKSVQPSPRKSKHNKCCGESTDCPISSDIHSTSTDTAVCRTQHKPIHQCCKSHSKKCDISSSSSAIDHCKHRCACRGHRSHKTRSSEKAKKCIAYNLILQTSDSIASEETDRQRVERHLKNIVVKVPSKRRVENMQFKEVTKKIERDLPRQFVNNDYTRNLPQEEVSSTDNVAKNTATCTIRDYLEQNRPDFVERSMQRQSCLKLINEERASERATARAVLSAHVARPVADPGGVDLRQLAELVGKDLRNRKMAPKFISEKEMKKHSEKIYKSLPEVQKKKEEIKKERIKKTNLLMANIFKKNLQKKTLRGAVNLSNYSAVIKI